MLQLSGKQGTRLLQRLHKEAFWRFNRLNSLCVQLLNHVWCSRVLPQRSTKACIKTGDRQMAQRLIGDRSEKSLHRLGRSEALGWTAQDEQIHFQQFTRVYLIHMSNLYLSVFP